MKVENIAILMAMHDEALPLVKLLQLQQINKGFGKLPMNIYAGRYKSIDINLVTNGKCSKHGVDHIGSQAATLAAFAAIEQLQPNLLINAGTAGGFKSKGTKIGDVYISHPNICFHDRRINLPGFREYGLGNYPAFTCPDLIADTGLKKGVVSTGSSLDFTPVDLQVMQSCNASVKDMEAAAIAWVAEMHELPFIAIKSITDLIDNETPTEIEFVNNLRKASENLSEKMEQVIGFIWQHGLR